MKVLVACEFSGRVRTAFRERGHDAFSCDVIPCENRSKYHFQCNVLDIVACGWDVMIAFPPCTYLASVGMSNPARDLQLTEEALDFVRNLLDAPIPRIALENPVGVISTRIRRPDQYVQPWWFGDPFTKKTGLWLKNLPLLQKECGEGGYRAVSSWHHACKSYGGRTESQARSLTFPGMAQAMARQWG